jgi:hypothetical protein
MLGHGTCSSAYPSMRPLVTLLIALTACFGNASELTKSGDDNDDPLPPFGSVPGACISDAQCTLTSASCCECPTFATSIDDPKLDACTQVDCDNDLSVCPTNVAATCNAMQQCELACAQLECLQCPDGYFLEANDCLSCTCAAPPSATPSCAVDSDCVRVRADCCGCDDGGDDTAVSTADAAAFDARLNCGANPQCPGNMNANEPTCDELSYTPRCARGECALLTDAMPTDACGRADLPACGPGKTCKINVNDSAKLYGVGVCVP